jgi:hypothetical protein
VNLDVLTADVPVEPEAAAMTSEALGLREVAM